jgi:hypothetical protein
MKINKREHYIYDLKNNNIDNKNKMIKNENKKEKVIQE